MRSVRQKLLIKQLVRKHTTQRKIMTTTLADIIKPLFLNTGDLHIMLSFAVCATQVEFTSRQFVNLDYWMLIGLVLLMLVLVQMGYTSNEVNIVSPKKTKQTSLNYLYYYIVTLVRISFMITAVFHMTRRFHMLGVKMVKSEIVVTPFLGILAHPKQFRYVLLCEVFIGTHLFMLVSKVDFKQDSYREIGFEYLNEIRALSFPWAQVYIFFLWRTYSMYRTKQQLWNNEYKLSVLLNNIPAVLYTADKNMKIDYYSGAIINDLTEDERKKLIEELTKFNKDDHSNEDQTDSCTICVNGRYYKTCISEIEDQRDHTDGCVGVVLDVTDCTLFQIALEESEANYRTLIENLHYPIMRIDHNYTIEYMNQDFFGVEKENYLNTNFMNIFSNDSNVYGVISFELSKVFDLQQSVVFEWKYVIPNSSPADVRSLISRVSPIKKGKHVVAAIILTCDFTERNRGIEQQRIAEEMRSISKSKSEFICQLSHEVKNPLNAIIGSLQLLDMNGNLRKQQTEHLNDALDHAKLLLTVISNVLDLTKIESGKIELVQEPICITEVVETVAGMYSDQIYAKGVDLYTFIDPRLPSRILGDRNRISQILMNFVSSSLKHILSGHISLEAHLLTETTTKATIRFECKDTGPGIREGQLETMYQPILHVITTREDSSSGESCSISEELSSDVCCRLAQLMNGHIGAESQSNLGARFYFVLEVEKYSSNPIFTVLKASCFPYSIVMCRDDYKFILEEYLKVFSLKSIHFVSSSTTLKNLVQKYVDKHEKVAIIVEDTEDQSYMTECTRNPLCRIICLAKDTPATNQAPDSNIIYLKSPVRLIRLMTALQDTKETKFLSATPDTPTTPQTPISPYAKSDDSILVVEDNQVNSKILCFMLKKLGFFKIDTAENGAIAVDLVNNRPEPYKLILMDLNMPVLNGQDAACRIREHPNQSKANTPIIAVTANADIHSGDEGTMLPYTFDDYISKPVSMEKLTQVVHKFSSVA
jgi:CheY-like chemotaxis protein/uncharacterized membrane protein YhaH (DUF805 family)